MANEKASSTAFSDNMKRMLANWPTDEDRAVSLLREFEIIFREFGEARFSKAVTSIIHNSQLRFFPSCAEFRAYIPGVEVKVDEDWLRTMRDKRAHPDDYFGEADVVCMWRAQVKRFAARAPLYTTEALIEIARRARRKFGFRYEGEFKPKPQPVREYQSHVEDGDSF